MSRSWVGIMAAFYVGQTAISVGMAVSTRHPLWIVLATGLGFVAGLWSGTWATEGAK